MAGLGEACSHVAAVLFTADANTKIKAGFSTTSLPCSWLPKSFQFVPYVEVKDMDFRTPSLKRKLESRQKSEEGTSSTTKQVFCVSASTTQSVNQFFANVSRAGGKPVALSHKEGFSDSYVPINCLPDFPKPLTDLFYPSFMSLPYPDLLKKCDEVYEDYVVTADQAKFVESKTQGQASSRIWFQQRSGRVTASKLKSVICTDPSQPSPSLIKSICYPEMCKFTSDACTYGCKHEAEA